MAAAFPRVRQACAALLLAAAGCTRPAPPAQAVPPDAEFLLAAGDSTYWIRSGRAGLSMRSSPLLLTHDGARFHEIYVSDDDRSRPTALFVAQRLWRRDLATGDSVELGRDSVVLPLAEAWRRAHPDEPPLAPDEEVAEETDVSATSEFEVLDVHGPYLSWVRRIDVERRGEPRHRHELLWRVSDVRSARVADYRDLFGPQAGATLERQAAAAFEAVRDSLARAAAGRSAAVRAALATLAFDPRAFTLADRNGAPRVVPMTAARDSAGEPLLLGLPALDVPGPPPAWWERARSGLPQVAPDSSMLRWRRGGYDVVARFDSTRDRLTVLLTRGAGAPPGEEFVVATVPGPAWTLLPLDRPAIDSTARSALTRAFLESQEYGGGGQQYVVAPPRGTAAVVQRRGTPRRTGRPVPVRTGRDTARPRG